MYSIEKLKIKQEKRWAEIRRYVEGEALGEALHKVEFWLFRKVLALCLSLLKEVVVRHGSGKTKSVIEDDEGTRYRYHGQKEKKYLSIFGLLTIKRAYYRSDRGAGCVPLDATLNLPQRRYSYLLQQWVQAEVAESTYDHALEMIRNILGLELSKRGQETAVRESASVIDAYYFEKPAPLKETEGTVLCATADCKGVRMVPSEQPEVGKPLDKEESARRLKGENVSVCDVMQWRQAITAFSPRRVSRRNWLMP